MKSRKSAKYKQDNGEAEE